ncbi:hypothetical protein ACFSO7_01260 [Bacillus sp. CGMCC 1.16607]
MDIVKMDIDQLLETTSNILEEECYFHIKKIEIDKLLEKTRDW